MKKLSIVLLTALMVLVLAACGDKKEDSTSGDKSQLEQIKDEGVINVGIEGAYPPFNYYNKNNELEGFDVDITNEVAKRLGVDVNFVVTPWDTIIGGLLSNKYEIIISSMAITEERKQKVDFTEPYYYTGAQFYAKPDTDVKDVETDLKGKKIGVTTGTTFTDEVERLGGEPVLYKSDALSFQDLENGRIDGAITDKAVGGNIIVNNDFDIVPVDDILYDEIAGITVNKGQEELVAEIDKIIKEMVEDGTYEEISMKWFNTNVYK